ncbi:hypothetical protein BJ165DRAFT_1479012 [Panaeolus papilionaceus]|nr:hypothetical protein BJ165DRAFT_1479012 [Panaeolus papilionaceus]
MMLTMILFQMTKTPSIGLLYSFSPMCTLRRCSRWETTSSSGRIRGLLPHPRHLVVEGR